MMNKTQNLQKEITGKQWAKHYGRKLPMRKVNKFHKPKNSYDRKKEREMIEEELEEFGEFLNV